MIRSGQRQLFPKPLTWHDDAAATRCGVLKPHVGALAWQPHKDWCRVRSWNGTLGDDRRHPEGRNPHSSFSNLLTLPRVGTGGYDGGGGDGGGEGGEGGEGGGGDVAHQIQ